MHPLEDTLFPHQKLSVLELEKRESSPVFQAPGLTHEVRTKFEKMAWSMNEYPNLEPCFANPYTVNSNLTIYADKKGAGKTRVISYLLFRDAMPRKSRLTVKVPISYEIDCFRNIEYPILDINIIIAGPSILKQWSSELENWDLEHRVVAKPTDIPAKLKKSHKITIVSTKCFIEYYTALFPPGGPVPRRIIYDEPDTAHMPKCPNLSQCQSLILITATSQSLRNAKGRGNHYIHSLFLRMHNVMRYTLTVKQPDELIDSAIALPPIVKKYVKFKTNAMLNAIIQADVLPPHVAEMINNGAIEEALKALGVDATNEKNLLSIATSKLDKDIAILKLQIEDGDESETNKKRIAKLETLEKKRSDLITRIEQNCKADCPICFVGMEGYASLCPHCYSCSHTACLTEWIAKSGACPSCRTAVNVKSLIVVKESEGEESSSADTNDDDDEKEEERNDETVFNTRSEAFEYLLDSLNVEGNRVLVFSGYDVVAERIESVFKTHALQYKTLKGSVETRSKKLQEFKKGECRFLTIDSRSDSAGIDIPETTHIIIYHDMEDNYKQQIIGRGQRIGRTAPLVVYELKPE
jgi:hypothetical protein